VEVGYLMEEKKFKKTTEEVIEHTNDAALKRKYLSLKKSMGKQIKELEDVKKEFFHFLEHQKDGALIIDLSGRITFCNHSVLKMCGFQKDEVLNRHFRVFLTLDDLAEGFKLFYNVLKGEYSTNNLFRVRNKDGTTRIVEVNASPLHQFGKVMGSVAIIRDLTSRKAKEAENAERVGKFIQFDKDLEEWKKQVEDLKVEVDVLRSELGKEKKYEKE